MPARGPPLFGEDIPFITQEVHDLGPGLAGLNCRLQILQVKEAIVQTGGDDVLELSRNVEMSHVCLLVGLVSIPQSAMPARDLYQDPAFLEVGLEEGKGHCGGPSLDAELLPGDCEA